MNKEEWFRCIDHCDKDYHAIGEAICIAHNAGFVEEISLDHIREFARRRHNSDYLCFSDEEIFATSLSPEQMAKFKKFFKQIPDLPVEFIRPFKPSEPAKIIEITESLAF